MADYVIPLVRPDMPPMWAVERHLDETMAAGQWSNGGPAWRRAAERLSERLDGIAVPVTSGTEAARLAVCAVTRPGQRVGVSAFTFEATRLAVIAARCTPVVMPARSPWLAPLPDELDHRTVDAVCLTSPFGLAVDFEAWDRWGRERGRGVCYDLAGAFGAEHRTANPRAYSFHATKSLPIGEGGCVVVRGEATADRLRRIVDFGFDAARRPVEDVGWNGKLDEWRSAVLLAQLDRWHTLDRHIQARRQTIAELAMAGLDVPDPSLWISSTTSAPSLPCCFVGDPDRIVAALADAGVTARRGYWPTLGFVDDPMDRVVCLPARLTPAELTAAVRVIRKESRQLEKT